MKGLTGIIIFLLITSTVFCGTSLKPGNRLSRSQKLAIYENACKQAKAGGFTVSLDAIPDTISYMPDEILPEDDPEYMKYGTKNLTRDLPASFNQKAEGNVTDARHQGSFPTCWAFAFVAMAESACLQYDVEGIDTKLNNEFLSPQDVINCFDKVDEDGGLSGSIQLSTIGKFIADKGVCWDKDETYKGNRGECANREKVENLSTCTYVRGKDGIKNAIHTYGACVVTLFSSDSFHALSGDQVYTNHEVDNGRSHAVLAVGWDDEGEYWIIKNSYGKSWGNQGFGRVKYGCSKIDDFGWYIAP